jgi:lipoyl(octanoyl) transferase
VPYAGALAWQRAVAQARIEGRLPHDVLLLVEHPPVITLGRNSREAHVLRGGDIDVFEVERGGDVTYHGPGQLVGYPILDLGGGGHRRDLHWYLRTLEQALIAALAEVDVPAGRRPGYTGVWTRGRKIASIGVHVKQWVTWHGFALNVTTDLAAFDRIVPCGIPDVVMTSVERETGKGKGERDLWEAAVAAVIRGFERAFGVATQTASRTNVEEMRRGEPCGTTSLDAFPGRFSSTHL